MEKTEQQKFLEETEQSTDIFEQPLEPEKVPEGEQKPEVDEENLRNRRERRLASKLEAERQAGIQLAAQLQAERQLRESTSNPEKDYLKNIERIYGTDSPEATQATELLKNALRGLEESASERAYTRLQEEQRKEREEMKKAEQQIETMLEELEEEHNVDMTSNAQTRTAFLKLMERMSPKDADGNIIAYADHHAVYEMYQSKMQKTENRAKELSSRSMTQSGASKDSTLQSDALTRTLIENGII